MKFNLPYTQFNVKNKRIVKNDFISNLKSFLFELKVPENSALAIAKCLYARMNDKNLFYHTPVHVLCMFQFAQKNSIILSEAQQLAIWFHDAIYIPTAKNPENEVNSSLFLHTLLSSYFTSFSQQLILEQARAIIYNTSLHLEDSLNFNDNALLVDYSNLVLDLDLCSFSFDFHTYEYVGKCIRKEYLNKSDEEFNSGRKKFLTSLKEKDSIFRTQYFKENFEKKAFENILKSLDKI